MLSFTHYALSDSTSLRQLSWTSIVLVLLVLLVIQAFLLLLDHVPLLDNNEGLYASIARQMLLDGHWVIPHLNGVAYLEKAPLL